MKRERLGHWAAVLIFALCAAMTAYYLIAGYGAYLDSDMASELALASHLAKSHRLISTDWVYSTEVRLLSTQLVFTPLMAMFPHNWQLVRTLGDLILLAILAGSTYFCARSLGARRQYALVFAGLSISACSIVYSQMILIGAYYVPHAVLTNLCVGMAARMMTMPRGRKRGLLFTGLLALSILMGASSIRYPFCATIPIAAAAIWIFVFPGREKENLPRTRAQIRNCASACVVCLGSLIGFAAGQKILGRSFQYDAARYGGSRLTAFTSENLPDLIQETIGGLARLLGYREHSILISVHGIVSMGAILLPVLAALLAVRAVKRAAREKDCRLRFGVITLIMSAVLTAGTFVLVENLYLNRYWIPLITLSASVLAACLSSEDNAVLSVLSVLAISGVVVLSSAMQIRESMASPEIGESDRTRAAYLLENDMDFGYATFWNANVLTELTDGEVEVVGIQIGQNAAGQGIPSVSVWLECLEDQRMNRPEEPVFLILGDGEAEALADFLELSGAKRQETPDRELQLWTIDTQKVFFETCEAMQDV